MRKIDHHHCSGVPCDICGPDPRDAEIARIKAEVADATARAERADAERDLLFDALNLHMRKTGITNEAMERVEAFRAVVDANEPLVRGECTRLAKGWNDAADARKAAEAERDAAIAACAEMRAAGLVAHDHACKMAEFHGPRCEEHERHDEAPDDCLRCAADTAFGLAFAELRKALSRPDLGRGMVVVPREVVERWRAALEDTLDEIMETWATCEVLCVGKGNTVSSGCVDRARAAIADLDALLKEGGG